MGDPSIDRAIASGDSRLAKSLIEQREREFARPTFQTDPGDCRWCHAEAFGDQPPCPYHGEQAQTEEE